MKPSDSPRQAPRSSPLLLAGAFFLLGAVLAGLWFRHQAAAGPGQNAGGLSPATTNLLGQLKTTVTIRYYSLLSGNADDALQSYAGRVGQLLDAIQDASGGKVIITTVNISAETNRAAASTDGIQAFNLEKGDADFLGLAIAGGKNKETFARLQPEWEPALEFDLARAILRVAAVPAPAPPAPEVAKPSSEIIASINRLIPDVNSTTVETADQIFHGEFMKEIAEASTEMEAQMNAAQQRVVQAQNNGSPDLDAAQKNLAQVESAQRDKIRQIAAELKTRLAVFKQMKTSTTNDAK